MSGIRDEIVARRRKRIAVEGHALGIAVPDRRAVPIVSFPRHPPVICEVKRRSPSRGDIAASLDPVDLVRQYRERGASSLSVLTEEDYFHGSLRDLMAVKEAYPDCAVLRKDFLLDTEDIEVSYRAGADAVLLIASVLTASELAGLIGHAQALGMSALVELHDQADVEKARGARPALVGINARNLSTFNVDPLAPIRLRRHVDWPHTAVYESGVFTREDARLAATSGFGAILVGEAVVREPDRIRDIAGGLGAPADGPRTVRPEPFFWNRLCERMTAGRTLVKICGITNREDAERAVSLGADMLGFVFAESPRRVSAELVRSLADLDVLKAAVVVTGGRHGGLPREVAELLGQGLLDVIQFHGDETPEECEGSAYPYYRAVRPASAEELGATRQYGCPRVLMDARAPGAYGGTGTRVAGELVRAAAEAGPVWLAGGLSDENIAETIRAYRPELVDVSSGLEASPGRKDPARLARFFKEIESV